MNYFLLNLIFLVFNECLSSTDGHQGGYESDYYLNMDEERNHILITPKILRPYISYGVMVHVFDNFFNEINNKSFRFHASISVRGDEITSVKKMLFWNSPQILYLPIPISLAPDNYALHVYAVDGGGKKVLNESLQLFYEANFVSVVFQTTRPIYSCGQTVRFRILVLETSLLPFNEVMDVFVLDPDGIVMKRWISIYTNNDEVASLKFQLPKLAKNGVWKIRTKIQNQIDEISIIVETYFQPYFEIIISSPAFISEMDDKITANIYGIFSTQKYARGNATVLWSARRFSENETFFEIQNDFIFIAEKPHQISLPLRVIREMFTNIVGVEIKIVAEMKEFMSGEVMSGYSHTRIISNNVKIEFISKSPIVFTPGMPLFGFVAVSLENNEKVAQEVLENSIAKVLVKSDSPFPDGRYDSEIIVKGSINEYSDVYEMLWANEIKQKYINSGIINYRFDIPKDTKSLFLKATYQHEDEIIETNIKTIIRFSSNEKFVNVWTSSTNSKINEYAMFHLKANFIFENVFSLVLSKGILLQIYDHKVSKSSSLITFSVPISSDMAPVFHLIVYCFSNDREMHSDAVTVPVDGFSRFETTLVLNTGKDFRNERIEAIASGGEGAFIGIQASRSGVYHLQGGNEITRDRVVTNFLNFEKNLKSIGKIDWITRDGSLAKESIFFPSFNYVFDGIHAFDLNYLNISSNWKISTYYSKKRCMVMRLNSVELNNCTYLPTVI